MKEYCFNYIREAFDKQKDWLGIALEKEDIVSCTNFSLNWNIDLNSSTGHSDELAYDYYGEPVDDLKEYFNQRNAFVDELFDEYISNLSFFQKIKRWFCLFEVRLFVFLFSVL